MRIRWWIGWGFYVITRLGDVLTTAYLLRRGGESVAMEASPLPRLFMRWFGAWAGNLIHEGAVLSCIVIVCLLFRPAQRRFRRWISWMSRHRVPLLGRIPPEAFSAIDDLSPTIVPVAVGIASAAVSIHNWLLILHVTGGQT